MYIKKMDPSAEEALIGFKASDAQLLEIITYGDNLDKVDRAVRVLLGRHSRAIQAAVSSGGARTREDQVGAYGEFHVRFATAFNKNRLACITERKLPVKWLYRVARNATLNYMERENRRKKQEGEIEDTRPPSLDPLVALVQQEKDAAIRAEIHRFPEGDREVAYLQEQGYNRGEISKILFIPMGTVDSRIHRIRDKLKHHSESENENENENDD